MGDAHDELSELHQAFIDSQVEVLPISVTRTNSIDRFVTDLDRYIVALNNRAKQRDNLDARGNQYTDLLETDEADRASNYDAQIKEAERQRDHAKALLKDSQADLDKVMSDSELPIEV